MTCCLFLGNYRALWCEGMFLKTHNKPLMPCFCVRLSRIPLSQICVATLLFPFPTSLVHHRQSFNLQSSIVQPVSNSWHCWECQSSIEAACFCSAKWERVPETPAGGLFPQKRHTGLLLFAVFTVRLLAPVQVTPSCQKHLASLPVLNNAKCRSNNASHSFAIIDCYSYRTGMIQL